jgi:hypothetical protein
MTPSFIRNTILAAVIFILYFPVSIHGFNSGDLQKIVKHFQWGEYDSILILTDPLVSSGTQTVKDPLVRSELYKYLGIAYYSKGKITSARQSLRAAYTLNRSITIDQYYVSKEIFELFTTTIAEFKNEFHTHDSLQNIEKIKAVSAIKKTRTVKITISSVLLAAAAVSVCYAVYQYRLGENAYSQFQTAANSGNGPEYFKYRGQVRNNDTHMVVSEAAAAVFTGAGLYFTFTIPKLPAQK